MSFLDSLYNTLANPVRKVESWFSPSQPMQFPVGQGVQPAPQAKSALPGPRVANLQPQQDPTQKLIADEVAKAKSEQDMKIGPTKRIAQAGTFIKDIAQAIPRGTASLALSATGQTKAAQPGGAGVSGAAQRLLLGDEPVEPMQNKLKTFTDTGEAIAKKYETPEQRKRNDPLAMVGRLPMVLPAALLGGTLEAVNFDPGVGGVEGKVAKEGAELAAREAAEKATREGGEQLIKTLAEKADESIPAKFLPKELANAKPRFNFGEKSFTPQFESDLDKAAYILAQKNPSKREADYLAHAMENSGLTEEELRAHGQQVKSTIKTLAQSTEEGKPLVVPSQFKRQAEESLPQVTPKDINTQETLARAEPTPSEPVGPSVPEQTAPLTEETTAKPTLKETLENPTGAKQAVEGSLPSKSTVNPEKPYFNLERLDISPEAKAQAKTEIEKMAPEVEKIVGKPLTHDEVLQVAKNTQSFIENTPVIRQETLAWEANNLKLRQELAFRLEEAAKNGGELDPHTIDLFFQSKSINEDLGRKLGSLAIDASPKDRTAIAVLLDQVRKTGATADKVVEAAKGVNFGDPKQVQEFYRSFVKPNVGDWLDLLRYNSMLSSPLTHIQNISSNIFGSTLLAPVQKEVAGLVDGIRAAFNPAHEREAFSGEGAAYLKGYVKSFGKAVDDMTSVMTGKSFIEHPDVHNIPLATSKAGKAAEAVLSTPVRMLEAADRFFQALAGGGEKAALEYRVARGGKVGNIEEEAAAKAQERLFRGRLFPKEQGHLLDTVDELTRLVQNFTHSENKTVATVSKFTVPFIKTPMNILKQGIEYSPLGFSTLWGAGNKSEQLSKALIGTLTAAGIGTLVASDRLTGEEPVDPTLKRKFQEAGMQPYSVKVGDKWYSYSKLHPALAFNFALMSAVKQAWDNHTLNDKQGNMVLEAFARHAKFFADQSYMKSIGEFIDAVRGGEAGWGKVAANYTEQLIPFRAMMGWINNITDPVKRQADPNGSILDQQMQWVMSQIPGLSQKVPARLDSQGKPILKQHNVINALSPMRVSTENEEKGDKYREGIKAAAEFAPELKEQKALNATNEQKMKDTYWRLRGLPKDQANAELDQLKKTDPDLVSKMKSFHESVNSKLSAQEDQMKKLNVGNGMRAKHIWNVLKAFPDKATRNAYLNDLREKKIITKDMNAQFAELSKTDPMPQ